MDTVECDRIVSLTKGYISVVILVLLVGLTSGVEDIAGTSSTKPAIKQNPYNSDPILTPWYPLTFSEGEQLSIDCGVYTGGDPVGTDLSWTGPGDKPLKILYNDRVTITRSRRNNHDDDSGPGAYSVLTFTLKNLTSGDSGVYTCSTKKLLKGGNLTKSVNITLTVVNPKVRCGFEGLDLCGWSVDTSSPISWHIHDADDSDVINRTKGARFDHTYGASKHIGRFLDFDVQHNKNVPINATVKVMSPLYSPHTEYKCVQFMYIYEGRDQVHLQLSLHYNNDSSDVLTQLWLTNTNQGNAWQLGNVTLSPQEQNYHLIFDAQVCSDRCTLAASALDDIVITPGKCSPDTPLPERNILPVRLVGGSTPEEGQVEVLHDGQWGSVCSEKFGQNEALVICKILGYGTQYAERRRNSHFTPSPQELKTIIWLERLACTGRETDLAQCIVKGQSWADTQCTHAEDAGVICSDVPLIKSATDPVKVVASSTVLVTTTARPSKAPPTMAPSSTSTVGSIVTPSPTPAPVVPSVTVSDTTDSELTTIPVAPISPKKVSPTTTTTTTTTTTAAAATTTTTTTKAPVTTTTVKVVSTTSTVTATKVHYVIPDTNSSKTVKPTLRTTQTTTTKPAPTPEHSNPDIVSLPPEIESFSPGNNAGVAIGVIFALLIAATGTGILLYRRRQKGKKSTYITFGNPSYSREHLPANDFSLESPLTLSSNGYTVLA